MTSTVSILLLDEEPILRRATALMLNNRGGKVTMASSLEEAIALTEKRIYDVAILDVSPDGPGAVEILKRIRERGLVPRRVVVCQDSPMDRREAQEFSEVLPKPYPFEQLLTAVFGPQSRRRPTRSGVFPRVRAGAATQLARPRRAAPPSRVKAAPTTSKPSPAGRVAATRARVRGTSLGTAAGSVVTVEVEAPIARLPATRVKGVRRTARVRRGRV